jgi:hypothetical protein
MYGGLVHLLNAPEDHLDYTELGVQGECDLTHSEVRLVLRLEGEIVREMAGSSEIVEDGANPFRDGGQLLLFGLDNEQSPALANLEQKQPVPDDATSAHHDPVGVKELVVHEGTNSLRVEVEFTARTRGVASPRTRALTEHVEMTVR